MVHGLNNININSKRKLKVYTCNKAKHIIFVILMYIKIIIINTHDNTLIIKLIHLIIKLMLIFIEIEKVTDIIIIVTIYIGI